MRITRRPGESVIINLNVRVTIEAIQDGRVRLTVDAPESVPVCGEEVIASLSKAAEEALARRPASEDKGLDAPEPGVV